MWNQLVKDLGEVKTKQKVVSSFVYKGDIIVTSIEASCGCTSVNWHENSKALTFTYIGEKIPLQVLERGENHFFTTKSILVKSITDGQPHDWSLLFRVKVVQ